MIEENVQEENGQIKEKGIRSLCMTRLGKHRKDGETETKTKRDNVPNRKNAKPNGERGTPRYRKMTDEKLTNSGMKNTSGMEVKILRPEGRISAEVVDAIVQNSECVCDFL